MNFSNLRNSITSNLLYYSWINLKKDNDSLYNSTSAGYIEPISKHWFDKTSSLIRNGNFLYKSKKIPADSFTSFHLRRKITLKEVKNKVIDNAFLLLLKPYFFKNPDLKNITLTECLRLCLNNLFNEF